MHFAQVAMSPSERGADSGKATIPRTICLKREKPGRESNGLGFLCLFHSHKSSGHFMGSSAQKYLWNKRAPPSPSHPTLPRHPRHRPNDVRMEQRRCHLVWGPRSLSEEREALRDVRSRAQPHSERERTPNVPASPLLSHRPWDSIAAGLPFLAGWACGARLPRKTSKRTVRLVSTLGLCGKTHHCSQQV